MGLSPGFYGQAKKAGYRYYCLPINPKTGNPTSDCITSTEWIGKYHYSRRQIERLLRTKRIRGFKYKGTLYLEDKRPKDYY